MLKKSIGKFNRLISSKRKLFYKLIIMQKMFMILKFRKSGTLALRIDGGRATDGWKMDPATDFRRNFDQFALCLDPVKVKVPKFYHPYIKRKNWTNVEPDWAILKFWSSVRVSILPGSERIYEEKKIRAEKEGIKNMKLKGKREIFGNNVMYVLIICWLAHLNLNLLIDNPFNLDPLAPQGGF